jgi:hypothetical protein
VVFPSNGTWTYRVGGFGALGAHQHWVPVRVVSSGPDFDSTPDRAGSASSDGDLPLGWIIGAFPLIVAIGLWVARRRAITQ